VTQSFKIGPGVLRKLQLSKIHQLKSQESIDRPLLRSNSSQDPVNHARLPNLKKTESAGSTDEASQNKRSQLASHEATSNPSVRKRQLPNATVHLATVHLATVHLVTVLLAMAHLDSIAVKNATLTRNPRVVVLVLVIVLVSALDLMLEAEVKNDLISKSTMICMCL